MEEDCTYSSFITHRFLSVHLDDKSPRLADEGHHGGGLSFRALAQITFEVLRRSFRIPEPQMHQPQVADLVELFGQQHHKSLLYWQRLGPLVLGGVEHLQVSQHAW